ncbi:MotA/TolQ/ExbB proton channel family protein [Thauera sinica]|uniref:MotA/TolQ/ExbB proton channel family protein n=1 Tax=Thauera sp. K11 TaxID=2005884 RepID=UPI000BBAC134|nr:MotA/TolQ/ExbB proton channel family protein [Thauera sp. K11]ATE60709.1 biopolymer transporter ExbB [Thauera sp. K11]
MNITIPSRLRRLALAALAALAALPSAFAQASSQAGGETVTNPYGLDALWAQGDFVAKGTLVILVIMSAASWYVIVTKLYEQHKLRRHATEAKQNFWTAGGVQQATDTLNPRGAFHFIAQSGLEAREHHTGLLEHIDLNTWVGQSIQRAIENVQTRLQDGLALLATVGSTAPFIGLFGTVWGIYHALTAIGIAGQASIDKVAGPVGEALIMTAIGLAVAVPAVLGYNWLVRRNKAALDEVRAFGVDLHAVLLGGGNARTAAAKLVSVARS